MARAPTANYARLKRHRKASKKMQSGLSTKWFVLRSKLSPIDTYSPDDFAGIFGGTFLRVGGALARNRTGME
jgi:hypothetical protein